MDPRSLYVRGGDLVLPAWNKLVAFMAANRIRAGDGVVISRSPLGVLISAKRNLSSFRGAFRISFEGEKIKVGRGFVNGLEPLIEKIPITGTDKLPPPSLALKEDKFDETGRSWICIIGKVDPKSGRIVEPKKGTDGKTSGKLELWIEQRDNRTDPDDLLAIKPIAMLKRPAKEKKGFGTLHQIALFDYQHRSAFQNKRWRHFFHPA